MKNVGGLASFSLKIVDPVNTAGKLSTLKKSMISGNRLTQIMIPYTAVTNPEGTLFIKGKVSPCTKLVQGEAPRVFNHQDKTAFTAIPI